jgi:hypothetical protein
MAATTDYRDKARRCRKLADAADSLNSARRWSFVADEYDEMAAEVERGEQRRQQRVRLQQPEAPQQLSKVEAHR